MSRKDAAFGAIFITLGVLALLLLLFALAAFGYALANGEVRF